FKTDTSETGRGFRVSYRINCTNTVYGYRGVIESPNYPELYNHNANCSWRVRAPRGNNITIAFSRLLIEPDLNCQFDYVKVSNYNPVINNLTQIAKYCGTSNQLPPPFNTTSSDAIVNFVSDGSVAHIGFRLEWVSVGCGGDFINKQTGQITSPNYPYGYPHDTECLWHIRAPFGFAIELTIQVFDLESGNGCTFDYMNVYGGPDQTSPLLLNQCHRIQDQKVVTSMGRSMTIKFKSDSSVTGRGFTAMFRVKSGSCSGRYTTETATITSPNFPNAPFDALDDCEFVVEVNGLHDIELTVEDLDIPSDVNCTQSYLAIYDGLSTEDPTIARICGTGVPATNIYRSTGNKVYIRMKANGQRTGKGFKLSYKTKCGGRKVLNSNEMGELTSPNYPLHSVVNIACHWILIASKPEEHITLTFTRIDIRESQNCNDYVEVRDGDSGAGMDLAASPLIGKYCGDRIPAPITSQGNALYITNSFGIFRATYATSTSFCGGDITSQEGIFQSPDYPNSYPLESECIWIIRAAPGNRVTFNFISFNLEESEYCNTDYVELREQESSGPLLGRYCGRQVPALNFTSTHILWVKFRSDQSGTAPGFQASYALDHGIDLTGNSGQIASPGYPHDIRPQDSVFSWTITVPQYKYISITFTELALQTTYTECSSYVSLLDGIGESAPELGRYCGYNIPDAVSSNGNAMTVNFVMTTGMPGKFFLLWNAVNETVALSLRKPVVTPVGNTSFDIILNKNSTYRLTSPGYPNVHGSSGYISTDDVTNEIKCEWIIKARHDRTIQLTFESLNIADNGNCQYSYILLKNGGRKRSPPLGGGRYCGQTIPTIPESSSDMIRVEFYARRDLHADFRLRYNEVSVGCGDHIELTASNSSVNISSPNYPQQPPHRVECDWVIMSPVNTNIRFDFVFQQMPMRCNKTTEFVEIRDGGTGVSTLIDKYCVPPTLSNTIRSSGNYIFVRFVTSNAENLANFKANVRISDCGGTYLAAYSLSQLSLPNYPNNYTDNMQCNYYLRSYYASSYHEINITAMDIVANSDCSIGDYVEFREEGPTGELIGRYCGSNEENTTISLKSKKNIVYISFKSDISRTGRGCGNTIENAANKGVLTSPNYPNSVSEYSYCVWYVFAPPGRSLKLTFLDYNLKVNPRNTSICLDTIKIYRGSYYSSQALLPCGAVIPEPIQTQSHVLCILFYSSGLAAGEGFRVEYSADEEEFCGGVLSGTAGSISSYRFGETNFTDQIDCVWDINVPSNSPNYTVAFRFDVFEIPASAYCVNSSLRFEHYNIRYRYYYHYYNKYCGNNTQNGKKFEFFAPNRAETNLGYPKLFLTTNYTNGYRGISGKYFIQECGGFFRNPDGEYVSPNYPDSYPIDSYCVWEFVVDWGQQLIITFTDFNLGTDCELDYVQIQQGFWSDSPTTDKYCGSTAAQEIHSSVGKIKVMFKGTATNRPSTGYRFKMYVRKEEHGCGGLLMNPMGNIHSLKYPTRYDHNVECVWNLQMHVSYHINFTFVDRFDIEKTDNCDKDYILFEEQLDAEDDTNWSQIGKYCGTDRPQPFKSRTNKVRVTFHTNDNINGDGFKLMYQIACGEVFTASTGVFTSPNYPNDYNNMIRCEYLILRTPKDYIRLEFDDDFDVETGHMCRWDAVDIYLGNNTGATHMGTYCGVEKPPIITSNAALLVTFRSDSSYVRKGFKASFSVTSCGGNYTDDTGFIYNPPVRRYNYMNCVWYITVAENRVIELVFNRINMLNNYNCYYNGLEIRDGVNSTAPLIGRYCQTIRDTGAIVKSSGNQLRITYRTDGYYYHDNIEDLGFRLAYRTTLGEDQGCGGVFHNISMGSIESPDIDNDGKYELDVNCWYHFILPEDKVVKITFSKLDIEESPTNGTKCAFDFVEVRDGLSHTSALVDRFCGTTIPSPIIGSTNKMAVQFFSDGKEAKTGFKAQFEAIDKLCGGFINVTNVTQTLSSLNYPTGYPTGLRCKWHFTFERNYYSYWSTTIRIKFTDLDINCNNNDYIEFSADTYTSHRIEPYRMCGTRAPPAIVAKRGLWMTFVTNTVPAVNHKGFSLNYTFAACNQTYNEDSGLIINTRYPDYSYVYSYTRLCQMNITAKVGHTIALYFNDFRIYRSTNRIGCYYGNMTIKDGLADTSPELKVLCGDTLPDPIFSSGNQLSIKLLGYSAKFFITYTTTAAGRGCGGNLTSFNGTFTSPLYPSAYNVSGVCKWFVHSFGLHSLTLRFTSLSLSSTIGCQTNYIEVYEGKEDLPTNRIIRICGDDNPAPIQSQGNLLLVKLVTNANNTSPGFRAQYSFNSQEMNATKQIMTSNLRPHITSDGSVYFPTDGILFRHNN
ncbi:unnamed protein product, partial [Medioppia subpectinata]